MNFTYRDKVTRRETTITLPTVVGAVVETYRGPFSSLDHVRVATPARTVLITRDREGDSFKVWFSDSISTLVTTSIFRHAISSAVGALGLEQSSVDWP